MGRRLISLDWALKRVLRSPDNFGVLEGFLTELLGSEASILEVLEPEANDDHCAHNYSRLDLKVKLASGEVVVVEVQVTRKRDYPQRMLHATSRVLMAHMGSGKPYLRAVKVISVNLVYYPVVPGDDYVYRGTTTFQGLVSGNELRSTREAEAFPTYYVLQMDQFQDVVRTPLDEWIYVFKNHDVPERFTARGLDEAREVMDRYALPPDEHRAYDLAKEDSHYQASMEQSEFLYGVDKGRAEGRAALHRVARKLLATLDDDAVAAATGLTLVEVARLRGGA